MVVYKEAIRLNPNLAIVLNNLAWLYAQKDVHLDDALALAQKAVTCETDPDYMDTLAWIYYKKQMCDEAEKTIREAVNHSS